MTRSASVKLMGSTRCSVPSTSLVVAGRVLAGAFPDVEMTMREFCTICTVRVQQVSITPSCDSASLTAAGHVLERLPMSRRPCVSLVTYPVTAQPVNST